MSVFGRSRSISAWERWALVGLFLVAFLPRAIGPVSRPLQWYYRSVEFMDGLLHGQPEETIKSLHPGVTAMWVAGGAEWLVYYARGALGQDPPSLLDTERSMAFEVGVAVFALALVISLCVLATWYVLRDLFGRRAAWVASLLVALDPFYIANSKVLHLDALLSAFMLLAALNWLRYLRKADRRGLVLTGVFTGLALLTKSPAIFLLLFMPFAALVDRGLGLARSLRARGFQHGAKEAWRGLLLPLAAWLVVTAVTFVVLWPGMWVQPAVALGKIWRGIVKHSSNPHPQALLFMGQITREDPGFLFHVMVVLFKTTFVSLPFFLAGLGLVFAPKREERSSLGLLALYILCFGLQMALASKKAPRYVLPFFPAIDVIAGLGVTVFVGRVARVARERYRWAVSGGLILLMVLGHGLGGVARHPYYGTLYNALVGGAAVGHRVFAPQDEAEGIDTLARYVDQDLDGRGAKVAVHYQAMEMLRQYHDGPIAPLNDLGARYRIFALNYLIREAASERWGEQWELYRCRPPVRTVAFDGLTYAWLYRTDADPTAEDLTRTPSAVTIGDEFRLLGHYLNEAQLWPGDALCLSLYWQSQQAMSEDDSVFVYLLNGDGVPMAGHDGRPLRDACPDEGCVPGGVVEDRHEIVVPADVPPGEYTLVVGMIEPGTGERLSPRDAAGQRLPGDQVVLSRVRVVPRVPWTLWVGGGGWLALIGLGWLLPTLKGWLVRGKGPSAG
jgi:hypothetical protein